MAVRVETEIWTGTETAPGLSEAEQPERDPTTLRKIGGFLINSGLNLVERGIDASIAAHIAGEQVLGQPYSQEMVTSHRQPIEIITSDETRNKVRIYNSHHLGNGRPNVAIPSEPLAVSGKHGVAMGFINRLLKDCDRAGMAIISRTSKNNRTVAQSARNFLESMDRLEEEHNIDTDRLILAGSSLGAIVGLEALAQAPPSDRSKIDRAVINGPGGLKSMLPDKDPLYMADTLRQLGTTEVAALTRTLLLNKEQRTLQMWRELFNTIPRSPDAWYDIGAMTLDIMRGPLAGIGQRLPQDIPIDIQLFENDAITTPHLWPVELSGHDAHVNVEFTPGSHANLLTDGTDFLQHKINDTTARAA